MHDQLAAAAAQGPPLDSPAPAGAWPGVRAWRGGERASFAHCRPKLIDTRMVRAELARLRGPRPATGVPSARAIRSTISGGA